MLEQPSRAWYGLELAKRADIGSATVYAALTRLERANLLESSWEPIDPRQAGRPPRRLYRLTADGERAAHELLASYKPRRRLIRPRESWPRHEGHAV
jgi:PadR family transcriptional regulator PadR